MRGAVKRAFENAIADFVVTMIFRVCVHVVRIVWITWQDGQLRDRFPAVLHEVYARTFAGQRILQPIPKKLETILP